MRSPTTWRASKYVIAHGRLRPSRDAGALAPSSRLIARLLTDRYQPALATHARGRLLDLGCGTVPFYAAYRDQVDDNICVDWPSSLHRNMHIDVFCDVSRTLPFADATFDTILSSDVIEHLPDPVLAFREMARLLRPGGKVILNTPFLYMLHEVPHDYYRHTRYSLERLAAIAGLRVVQLEEIGGLPEVLADMLGKGIGTLPLLGGPLAIFLQATAIALGKTSVWARLRRMSRDRFPLGYFLVAAKPGLGHDDDDRLRDARDAVIA